MTENHPPRMAPQKKRPGGADGMQLDQKLPARFENISIEMRVKA
jgi:hypothetical protein